MFVWLCGCVFGAVMDLFGLPLSLLMGFVCSLSHFCLHSVCSHFAKVIICEYLLSFRSIYSLSLRSNSIFILVLKKTFYRTPKIVCVCAKDMCVCEMRFCCLRSSSFNFMYKFTRFKIVMHILMVNDSVNYLLWNTHARRENSYLY